MLKAPSQLVTNAKKAISEIDCGPNTDAYRLIIDVRESSEYGEGHIPDSKQLTFQ